jgi:hypothetical protein
MVTSSHQDQRNREDRACATSTTGSLTPQREQ